MSLFESKILPVPKVLQNEVACIRTGHYHGDRALAIHVPTSGLPGIIFQHHAGNSPVDHIARRAGHTFDVPTLYVHGQITEPSVMQHKAGPYALTQVILMPHALKVLFGHDASALTDRAVELGEVGARGLDEQLVESSDETTRIELLTSYLISLLQQTRGRDALVEESLRFIHHRFTHHNLGAVTVKCVLDHLSVSERHFERRFRESVGVSPQFYLRVKRFNAAVRLMDARRYARLADVAHALNYYDESHLIRDVKAFAGTTPKFLAQRADDFQPGQAEYLHS